MSCNPKCFFRLYDQLTVIFRYLKYVDLACKGIIAPEKLPPSERAVYYHGLRSHYQIMLWSILEEDFNIPAIEWGWQMKNNMITPVMTDKEIAPENLTKVIRCKCKVKELHSNLFPDKL